MDDAFSKLNGRTDADVENTVDAIVSSLFSVLVTLGVVPIIRCPTNSAAGMVGEKLNKRLHDHLVSPSNLFTDDIASGSNASFHRPVLILMDRSMDLCAPLQHNWTYQAMVHDLLGMRLNKVEVEDAGGEGQRRQTQTFDLTSTDTFWAANAFSEFPKVADNVKASLTAWESEVRELKMQRGEGDATAAAGGFSASDLMSAVDSLPELAEKKRIIDMHANIATALLAQINERDLDIFFSLESTGKLGEKGEVLQMLDKGNGEDKLRLFLLHLMTVQAVPEADMEQFEAVLREKQVPMMGAVRYLQYLRRVQALDVMMTSPTPQRGGASFTSKVESASRLSFSWMKSLVTGAKELAITRLVDALMDLKQTPQTETFQLLDPKSLGQRGSAKPRAPFREAIVFVCGGGNYVEHRDLQLLCQKPGTSRSIIYGSTSLVTPSKFMAELAHLGDNEFSG